MVTTASTGATTHQVQALVIGTGISGLFTALKLSGQGIRTLLVTKSALDESNSRYAQGGIAAVLPNNPDDSLTLHLQDTLRAGAGLCDEEAARSILSEGYPAIEDLLSLGVPFDRKPNHDLAVTREAAHSVERIIHAGGDATGHQVEMTLVDKVRQDPNITVLEFTQVVGLLMEGEHCRGCRAVDYRNREEHLVFSPHTILATGGLGRLYSHTTNPAIATGDGIALAHAAGARIERMEFIQFHPTAFYSGQELHFLISEALRGEGGILRDRNGRRFARHYHPDGELAPRDVVTRAIYAEMQTAGMDHVFLDISHLPAATIEKRFPTILANCLNFGVDIRKDWIPVAPAAHYLMGGIAVDVHGRSTVPNLYAVGETAHTGLHGANRLASNSLLECVVLARRVASQVGEAVAGASASPIPPGDIEITPRTFNFASNADLREMLNSLHKLMWASVGILRDEQGLSQALSRIEAMIPNAAPWHDIIPAGAELGNQLIVARLIAKAALDRRESIGAHYRTDHPETIRPVGMPVTGTPAR